MNGISEASFAHDLCLCEDISSHASHWDTYTEFHL